MRDLVQRMQDGEKIVIGMVHCRALPGTRNYDGDMEKLLAAAVADAVALEQGGADAVMVENGNDAPSAEHLETAQVAALAAAARRVRDAVSIPIGVDAAFNDCKAALAVCVASGGSFIRCPVFADTVVSGAGVLGPCNREATLYRRWLGAEHVRIFADVQVKHAYLLNPNIPIEESASWAASRGADAIIVTGASTGCETPLYQVRRAKNAVKIPVLAGSGVVADNAAAQFEVLDGAIIGSFFKRDGNYANPVDPARVRRLMDRVRNR